MAAEKSCDRTGARIVGLDAGEGPMIIKSDGYVIRVEVIASPPDIEHPPNLRWDAVRRMIEAHTDDPAPESEDDGDDVLPMEARKPA